MRDRVDLIADHNRPTFEGCSLEVSFTDGSRETHNVDNFLGTPGARAPDAKLASLFAQYSEGVLRPERAAEIIDAIWKLDKTPNLTNLISILRTNVKSSA